MESKNKFKYNLEEEKKKFKISPDAPKQAVDRVLKDYIQILASKDIYLKLVVKVFPKDDLFLWEVQIFNFDQNLGQDFMKDLQKYGEIHGQDYVKFEMKFPNEYPFKPPILKVISPKLIFHTNRMTFDGSICFELFTELRWNPICDLESVFLELKKELIKRKPIIDFEKGEYTKNEIKFVILN